MTAKTSAPVKHPLPESRSEGWLRAWYAVICTLPSALECDATLVVAPEPVPDPVIKGEVNHGSFHWLDARQERSEIVCALEPMAHVSIATLLHEVAHFAQNIRHTRDHGYSWRRAFTALCIELTGADPTPRAEDLRRRMTRVARSGAWSRRGCLDTAVEWTVADAAPRLFWNRDKRRLEARCGDLGHPVPKKVLPLLVQRPRVA